MRSPLRLSSIKSGRKAHGFPPERGANTILAANGKPSCRPGALVRLRARWFGYPRLPLAGETGWFPRAGSRPRSPPTRRRPENPPRKQSCYQGQSRSSSIPKTPGFMPGAKTLRIVIISKPTQDATGIDRYPESTCGYGEGRRGHRRAGPLSACHVGRSPRQLNAPAITAPTSPPATATSTASLPDRTQ